MMKHNPTKHIWRLPITDGFSAFEGEWKTNDILHHELFHILRLQKKDTLELCDGKGTVVLAQVETIDKKSCHLKTLKTTSFDASNVRLHMVLGQLKTQALEEAISHLCQLGVHRITIAKSEWSTSSQSLNKNRLEKLSWEALRTNKWPWKTQLFYADSITELQIPHEESVFLFQEPLSSIENTEIQCPLFLNILNNALKMTSFIGPERGFSESEVHDLQKIFNAQCVSLGKRVLRAPMAAVAAAVIALHAMEKG